MQQVQIGTYMIELWGVDDICTHSDAKKPYPGYISTIQTHSTEIYSVADNTSITKLPYEADAIINTSINRLGIGVYVADCVPLILIKGDMYTIVHLSWKTLYDGLLQKVLGTTDWSGAHVYMGPHHSADTYEVGDEFVDMFDRKYLPIYNNRYHLDMVLYITDILYIYGITDISCHPESTYTSNNRRSYRGGAAEKRNFVGVRPL